MVRKYIGLSVNFSFWLEERELLKNKLNNQYIIVRYIAAIWNLHHG